MAKGKNPPAQVQKTPGKAPARTSAPTKAVPGPTIKKMGGSMKRGC